MNPENRRPKVEARSGEDKLWDEEGSFLIRDFVGGMVYKAGYFGHS